MRYLMLIFITSLIISCNLFSTKEESEVVNGFKITAIEEVQKSQWDSGIFYQASEETGLQVTSIEDVTHLLNSEIAKGISIKSAWYKEHRPSCGTPYGNAIQVVVPTTVVIQLNKETDGKLTDIFEPVDEPQLICPYFIQNLQPIEDKKFGT